jgi:putative tryptophan/tyrosine transport system substrate-binding protein
MRRRDFITLLGGAGAAWPLAARAQQPAMPVVGLLDSGLPDQSSANRARAFSQGLSETGYFEGQNVAIEYRYAEFQDDRLRALAVDLVEHRVSVIAALEPRSAIAAKAATSAIPIVFAIGGDPVKLGLVASLNRPGGNATGVSFLVGTLGAKRLELLQELVPTAALIGFLVDPTNPNAKSETSDIQMAADALGRKLIVVRASTESEIDAAFTSIAQQQADALIIAAQAFFSSQQDRVVAMAERHAIPAIYDTRQYPAAGGLMSYGTSSSDAFRQAGVYAGRILKGEKPADLPTMQSTRFELVINLKTAKALRAGAQNLTGGSPVRPRAQASRGARWVIEMC